MPKSLEKTRIELNRHYRQALLCSWKRNMFLRLKNTKTKTGKRMRPPNVFFRKVNV